MALDEGLTSSFSHEVRHKGQVLFDKGVVLITMATDSNVRAIIKASGASKVFLSVNDIADPSFSANCSCSSGKKGRLCPHIWAVMLKLDEQNSDFLEGKNGLSIEADIISLSQDKSAQQRIAFKKENYEKQKLRAKELRKNAKNSNRSTVFEYPPQIEEARSYFKENGCTLDHPLQASDLVSAKTTLSRVFHPDKGGTHEEAIELNHYFSVIHDYLNS